MNVSHHPRAKTLSPPLKLIQIIAVICILLASIYAHFAIADNDEYTGPMALLDRIFDVAFVLALAALTFAIGRRLAVVLQLKFLSVAEDLSFSVMLGTGCLGLSVLGFGLLGLLKPLPLSIFILLLVAFLRAEFSSLIDVMKRLLDQAFRTPEDRILSTLYLTMVLLLVIRAATPPWAVDEATYHLPATRLFVEQGRIFPLYHQPLGNMPFLIHMIYALCLLAKTDIAARLFSLLLTLLTSVALYGFSVRFLTRNIGVVAMFGFLAASMVVEVGISTRIDVSLAGMLFMATYAMMVHLESGRGCWLYAAAILSGFSLGIKLNALLWIVCLGLMFLFESRLRARDSVRNISKNVALYVLITLAIGSPWLVKNLIWFHNPIYPFISGEVAEFNDGKPRYFNMDDERKLDAHFDAARTAAPEQYERIKKTMDLAASEAPHRHPMRFWEYYTDPVKYFMGDYLHYPNYLFLVLPFFVIVPRKRWIVWLLLLGIAFFLLLSATSWIARFLLTIYPSLTLVSAYTLVELSKRFAGKRATLMCFVVVGFCMLVPLLVSYRFMTRLDHLGFILGKTSRSQFMSGLFYYPPIDYINRNLPPDAGVLSIGGEMCYHMHRHYISDGSWDGTEWRRLLIRNASLADVSRDLKSQGISHVLFARWYFEFIGKTGWPKPGGSRFLGSSRYTDTARVLEFGADYTSLRNWVTFDRYRRECLELIYTDQNGYEIYRIK